MSRKRPVLGIIGGGQLAAMLCEAAKKLDLESLVFAGPGDESAREITDSFVAAKDLAEFRELLKSCDFLTFENEFFPQDYEQALADAESSGLRIFPPLAAVLQLRRKDFQKQIFQKLSIPTSPYRLLDDADTAESFLAKIRANLGADFVLKLGTQGYDGKGLAFSSEPEALLDFIRSARQKGQSLYAEAFCKFEKELAIIAGRKPSGELVFFPLVESKQDKGICLETWFYDGADGEALFSKAKEIAKKILEETSYVGAMGFEFFAVKNAYGSLDLWLNEVAPRVHNSGHYSQDTGAMSQFEAHLRSALNLDYLSVTGSKVYMRNVLGPEAFQGPVRAPVLSAEYHLHWYNKTKSKPRRKLGHVNIAYSALEDRKAKSEKLEIELLTWKKLYQGKK